MATLTVPHQAPDAAEDSEQLHKAFSGWGTNEALIISILPHRNAAQRKLIREVYSSTYGDDLLKDLDDELSSDFQRELIGCLLHLEGKEQSIARKEKGFC